MKRNIVIGTIFFTIIAVPSAYATTQSDGSSTSTPTVGPTVAPIATNTPAPTPSPTNSPVAEPSSSPTATTAPATPISSPTTSIPSHAPGMAPGEHGGWVLVLPNGNPSGGVIVCTPEVCGQTGPGSFIEHLIRNREASPGSRFILQTLQDPVEARNSSNGVGNVAGYNDAKYNFETNKWLIRDDNNSGSPVYEIPLAYPGADRGGNINVPTCVLNCPTLENDLPSEPVQNPSLTELEQPMQSNIQDINFVIQERKIIAKPSVIDDNILISQKINDKIFKNQVRVVAIKGKQKKIWVQQVSGKIVNIKIPRKYLFWNISIRYIVG